VFNRIVCLNDPVNLVDPWGLIWVTTEHDYHGTKNWGRGFLNWLTRKIGRGWDPNIPGSHPSDYEGTTRDVIQKWQHDKDNPCRDSEHSIDAHRRIKQQFQKKPTPKPGELWDATTTHYWGPPVSTKTYDDIPGATIQNDLSVTKMKHTVKINIKQ